LDSSSFLNDPVSRRAFMARMTAAGLGTAAAMLLAGCGNGDDNNSNVIPNANFPGIPGRTVTEVVLNYALTLEILEADLYRQALNKATGRALTENLAANSSAYTLTVSGGGLADPQAAFAYLRDFAFVEAAHRDFLTTAIQASGGTPVTRRTAGYKQLVATAVAIHSTEARHSSIIDYLLEPTGNPGPEFLTGDRRVTDRANAENTPSEDTFQYYLDPPTVIAALPAYNV